MARRSGAARSPTRAWRSPAELVRRFDRWSRASSWPARAARSTRLSTCWARRGMPAKPPQRGTQRRQAACRASGLLLTSGTAVVDCRITCRRGADAWHCSGRIGRAPRTRFVQRRRSDAGAVGHGRRERLRRARLREAGLGLRPDVRPDAPSRPRAGNPAHEIHPGDTHPRGGRRHGHQPARCIHAIRDDHRHRLLRRHAREGARARRRARASRTSACCRWTRRT